MIGVWVIFYYFTIFLKGQTRDSRNIVGQENKQLEFADRNICKSNELVNCVFTSYSINYSTPHQQRSLLISLFIS